MTEDRFSFSLKGEKCDSADTLDYPAGQAHITVISGRFRIDGRDQELERGTSTVDDKNIHSLEAFPVVVPSLIAKASQLLPFKNHGFLFGQVNSPNHPRLSEQPVRPQSCGVKVPITLIARFERLVYPGHDEVTNHEMLGCKSHSCPGEEGRSDQGDEQRLGSEHNGMTAAPKTGPREKSLCGTEVGKPIY